MGVADIFTTPRNTSTPAPTPATVKNASPPYVSGGKSAGRSSRANARSRVPHTSRTDATIVSGPAHQSARALTSSIATSVLVKSLGTLFDEGAGAQLVLREPQLLRRVHDDRAIPRHRFLERLARHQQEANPLVAGAH